MNLASASTISVDNGAAGNIDFQISGVVSGGAGSTLSKAGADTLVLGCTHFPALRPTLQALVGLEVTLIDTGGAVARRVAEQVAASREDAGRLTLFTSGTPTVFSHSARAILGVEWLPMALPLVWKDGRLENA